MNDPDEAAKLIGLVLNKPGDFDLSSLKRLAPVQKMKADGDELHRLLDIFSESSYTGFREWVSANASTLKSIGEKKRPSAHQTNK